MAGTSIFGNLARAAKIMALLLFLLPWVTVSCSPQGFSDTMAAQGKQGMSLPNIGQAQPCVLISASGLQLALGDATPRNDCFAGLPTNGREPEANNGSNPFGDPNIAVIAAAGLILLALIATFLLKGGAGAGSGAAGSLLAACAIVYAVMVQAPAAVRASFASGAGGSGPTPPPEELERMIHTSPAIGFWLVVALLLVAIAFNLLAMKKRKVVTAGTPPPAV